MLAVLLVDRSGVLSADVAREIAVETVSSMNVEIFCCISSEANGGPFGAVEGVAGTDPLIEPEIGREGGAEEAADEPGLFGAKG